MKRKAFTGLVGHRARCAIDSALAALGARLGRWAPGRAPAGRAPWIALLVALGLTVLGWHTVARDTENEAKYRFDYLTRQVEWRIQMRMQDYERVLQGAAGLFAGSDAVTPKAWRGFIDSQRVQSSFPGVQGVGFVSGREMAGAPGKDPATLAADRVMGLARDTASSLIAERPAADGGKAAAPRGGPIPGFVLYTPVYRDGVVPATLDGRRAALIGFVFSPFQPGELLQGIVQQQWPEIRLQVFDGPPETQAALLYSDLALAGDARALEPSMTGARTRKAEVLGHALTLVFRPGPAFEATVDRDKAPLVLIAGAIVSVLLFLTIRSQTLVGERATRLAQSMTKELAQSEARCRRLYEGSPAMLHSFDREGRLVAVSDAWLQKLGYRREEVIGRSSLDFLTPSSRARAHQVVLPQFFQSGRATDIDYQMVCRDGSIVDVLLTAELQPGEPIHSLALIEDVTARKRAEREALAARARMWEIKDRLAAIVAHSADAIISESLDGAIVTWNRGAETLFGYPATDIVGKTIAVLIPPELGAEEQVLVDRVVRGDVVAQYQSRRVHRDGRLIDVSMTLSPICDAGGTLVGVSRVVRDITPQRMLQEVQARQAAILQSAGVSIISTDARGNVGSFNTAAERMLGYRAQDVVGQSLPALIHLPQEIRAQAKALGAETGTVISSDFEALVGRARNGGVDQREWTYVRCDGSRFTVALSVSAIDAGDGRISGFICVAVDISSRKAHEQLQRSALLEKETLLKEVYHRVKNNLQVVSSLFHLQLRTLPEGAARTVLQQSADRVHAMALVHEKLCRLNDHESIDIVAYVQELCGTLAAVNGACERGIAIEYAVEPLAIGLESSVPLGLLLNELICNSLKHAYPDGRNGKIRVSLRRGPAGKGLLEVGDDGIGFAADLCLQRPASLGLRLVNTLARQLGGTLHMQARASTPGTASVGAASGAPTGARTVLLFDLDEGADSEPLGRRPGAAPRMPQGEAQLV
jgi:PAS domain S-box-containing protein